MVRTGGEIMTEDITYCSNNKCGYLRCERNPKHIRLPSVHSFADFDGTELCYKAQNHVEDRKVIYGGSND